MGCKECARKQRRNSRGGVFKEGSLIYKSLLPGTQPDGSLRQCLGQSLQETKGGV